MKKKVIAIVVVVVLIVVALVARGCSAASTTGADAEPEEQKYIPVEVLAVNQQTLANQVSLSGKVFPNKEVMVLPKTPGKVSALRVKVGDKVQPGAVLFQIDPVDVQKQVAQAEAGLNIAKANYEQVKEQIEMAMTNLERQKALYEAGVISKVELEQAELQASGKSLATIEAQVSQAETAYNQALAALNDLTVTAPIGGVVSAVNIEVGEMASNAQPALTIVDVDRVYVEVSVPENIVNALSVGQDVEVAIASASNEAFIGKIDSISPASDQRTQLFPVKIYLDNPETLIKAGMFAKVNLATQIKEGVLAVPSAAVLLYKGETVVYVVEGEQAVLKRVTIGMDTGTQIEVIEGLNEGEQVIVKGQDYVEDGSIVKIVGGTEE